MRYIRMRARFSCHNVCRVNFHPLLSVALVLLLCGCSSFNRDWKKVASTPVPADSIEGRWEGRWLSSANGHNGRLRCLITREDDDPYEARFYATYMKVLRFGYTVPLTASRSNDVWHFQGDAELGKMAGGRYRYEGTATPMRFHSTYDSQFDRGHFEMQRPEE